MIRHEIHLASLKKRESFTAYTFIAPFIAGYLIFAVIPILMSFAISFLNINSLLQLSNIAKIKFTGFENFSKVFQNPDAINGFLKSLQYTAIVIPLGLIVPFLTAVIINKEFYLKTTSRSMIFMPYVSNIVGIAIAWSILLDPFDGPVTWVLEEIGIANPPMWLAGANTVIPTVAVISVWWGLAFPTIMYMVALNNVPKELFEAATVDGAGAWKKLRCITIPLITPTTFFLLVTSLISSFQNFAIFNVFTKGGPGRASQVISLIMYEEAFVNNRFSSGNAIAFILFIIILLITIVQWKGQKKWVHY